MNNAVTKLSSEYFTPLRISNNKTGSWLWLVGSCPKLIAKMLKVRLSMPLKVLLIGLLSFMPASIKIGLMQIGK